MLTSRRTDRRNLLATADNHVETMNFLGHLQQRGHEPAANERWHSQPGRGFFRGAEYRGAVEDWNPRTYHPNEAWLHDAKAMRDRAWDLYRNNPFAKKAIRTWINNVVECGLLPKFKEKSWNNAFKRWGGIDAHATRHCDLSRDSTFVELEKLWYLELMVGGGCIQNFVYLDRKSQRIPVSIELIGEERIADDIEYIGTNPKTRNHVIGGREIEQGTGRTVAILVYPAGDDLLIDTTAEPIRIPVENCEYAYLKPETKANAKRGFTACHTTILYLHSLGYYLDRELFNANLRSQWAYTIERDPQWCPRDGDNQLAEELSLIDPHTGQPATTLKHSLVYQSTGGGTVKAIGPNVPGSDSVAWIRLMSRAIALGFDMSMEAVFRDTSEASMGQLRWIQNGDERVWTDAQKFGIHHFVAPMTHRFLDQAVIAGIDGFPSPSAYLDERDELLEEQEFTQPGWKSFTPLEDARANDINIRNNSDSVERIAERSGDAMTGQEIIDQSVSEFDRRSDAGFPLQKAPAGAADNGGGTDSGRGESE